MREFERQFPTRVLASCFSLAAFAIAIVSGLAADRSTGAILGTAILALFICQFLGLILGMIVEAALDENMERYRQQHPVPDLAASADQAEPAQPSQSAQPE